MAFEFVGLTDGNDGFVGTAADEQENGSKGNDLIFGGEGNDWLIGAEGDDSLAGGSGTHTAFHGFYARASSPA